MYLFYMGNSFTDNPEVNVCPFCLKGSEQQVLQPTWVREQSGRRYRLGLPTAYYSPKTHDSTKTTWDKKMGQLTGYRVITKLEEEGGK